MHGGTGAVRNTLQRRFTGDRVVQDLSVVEIGWLVPREGVRNSTQEGGLEVFWRVCACICDSEGNEREIPYHTPDSRLAVVMKLCTPLAVDLSAVLVATTR